MPTIGVAALIQKPHGKPGNYSMLIGQRGQGCSRGKGLWAVPGGHVDGETIEQAVVREVKEETGLIVRVPLHKPFAVPGLLAVTEHFASNVPESHKADHLTFWVRCFWQGGEPVVTEPTKCSGWHWMTLRDIAGMVGEAGEDENCAQYHWTPIPLWRAILHPYFGDF